MTSTLGLFGLALVVSASLSTAAASIWSAVTGRVAPMVRAGGIATLIGAALAVAAVEWALVSHDFTLRFVAENGSRSTPLYYTVTSLWSAHDGSLLLWILVLASYLSVLAWRVGDQLRAWAIGITAAVSAFFGVLAFLSGGVFSTVSTAPSDGPGPLPLLRSNPAMGIHPPLLYVGLVGLVVPFSYAVAGLITGRVGRDWREAVEGPLRVAWIALSAGILLGAWWSYAVLGWGGYWSWDPVENSSLMPWLLVTALVHGLLVQRRTGALAVWNVSLAIGAFLLAAGAVVLTRSGVAGSVHAFADSGVGPVLLGFLVALTVAAAALLVLRVGHLAPPRPVGPPLSRGGALLAGNVLLAACCATILLGTLLPVVARTARHEDITVGPPYYDRMAVPAVLILLVLMTAGPLLAWRRDGGGSVPRHLITPFIAGAVVVAGLRLAGRGDVGALLVCGLATALIVSSLLATIRDARHGNSRTWLGRAPTRLGSRLAHVGLAVIAVGVAASSAWPSVTETTLTAGDDTRAAGLAVRLVGVDRSSRDGDMRTAATIRIEGRTLTPSLMFFPGRDTTIAGPAIDAGIGRDLYVTLLSVDQSASSATVRIAVNPMVDWIWAGGLLVVAGAGLSFLRRAPARRESEVRQLTAEPVGTT